MPGSMGTYSVVATLRSGNSSYDCTSTGRAPDGSVEVVVASFRVRSGRASRLPWGNNVFYFAGYGGRQIDGNGVFNGPFYVVFPPSSTASTFTLNSASAEINLGPFIIENGDVSIKAAPSSPVEVYTTGRLVGNAVGSPNLINRGWDPSKDMPVTRVDIPSFLDTSRSNAIIQSSDNKMGDRLKANYEAITVGDPNAYTSLALSPPNNRPTGWVRSKAGGAASAYKVLDHGLTISASTASFGSWSGDTHYPTSSDLHDDLAYDATNHILYLEGTVYVTGDVLISQPIRYVGNGTIVCSGSVRIDANVVPDTPVGSDGLPDPDAKHLLGIFTPTNLTMGTNNIALVAAVYMVGTLEVPANNTTMKGSFVAEQGLGRLSNGSIVTAFPALGDYVSIGLPYWGSGSDATNGAIELTSWRRE